MAGRPSRAARSAAAARRRSRGTQGEQPVRPDGGNGDGVGADQVRANAGLAACGARRSSSHRDSVIVSPAAARTVPVALEASTPRTSDPWASPSNAFQSVTPIAARPVGASTYRSSSSHPSPRRPADRTAVSVRSPSPFAFGQEVSMKARCWVRGVGSRTPEHGRQPRPVGSRRRLRTWTAQSSEVVGVRRRRRSDRDAAFHGFRQDGRGRRDTAAGAVRRDGRPHRRTGRQGRVPRRRRSVRHRGRGELRGPSG